MFEPPPPIMPPPLLFGFTLPLEFPLPILPVFPFALPPVFPTLPEELGLEHPTAVAVARAHSDSARMTLGLRPFMEKHFLSS